MENRTELVREYFRLMVLLNRSNDLPNEKTQIYFKILRSNKDLIELTVTTRKTADSRYITLCLWRLGKRWIPSAYTGLTFLEKFCADELNFSVKKQKTEFRSVSNIQLSSMASDVQEKLRDLALSKDLFKK